MTQETALQQLSISLNNGLLMPLLGFGTYRLAPGLQTYEAMRWAIEVGYRLFDTASAYQNESDVGRALRDSGLSREEYFLTTKLRNSEHGYACTLRAFDASRRRLGLDTVDLYLIHWPQGGELSSTWEAMSEMYLRRDCAAIGVSNFEQYHLDELAAGNAVVPAVNQIECNVFSFPQGVIDYCRLRRIQPEAYSPLNRGMGLDNPVIADIAKAHGRTPAQIVLRRLVQVSIAVIPKSSHRERIEENARLFDFSLTEEQMRRLGALG